MITSSIRYVYRESGLASVFNTGADAWIIILARTCRMFAYGASALVLALFFAELDVSDERIGLFMTLTLAGDVGLSLLLTLVADHVGRRRTLMFGSVLMIMSGTTFALSENYWLLLVAAVAGVISATGGDFGPFRAVEESMLSELTNPNTRADVLVWYVTTSALGSAVGTEVAGRAVHYLNSDSAAGGMGWPLRQAYHACYWAYAAMGILNLVLSLMLSTKSELQHRSIEDADTVVGDSDSTSAIQLSSRSSTSRDTPRATATPERSSSSSATVVDDSEEGGLSGGNTGSTHHEDDDSDFGGEGDPLAHPGTDSAPPQSAPANAPGRFSQISKKTRSIMYGLWFLLMVDSLADGMASIALTSYYLDSKFHMGKDSLGNILSISYLLAAFSSVFAGPLSRYIGLINTMVFTHVPSSAAVLLFPLPNSIGLTYALLLLRIGLNNLDQAPRAALIAAVVRPEERTAVLGITSLLRTLASTTGPTVTGFLAGNGRFWIAFVVAGALRLAYDFGLFAMFVNIRLYQYEPTTPPKEASSNGSTSASANDTHGDYSSVPGHPDAFVLDEEESIAGDNR
ncbi:MFS transporter [Sporothrix schenckii 1099-18]|uniref:MFS transporter n=1 Tax=Sporothrix schenckii 1099-18 TaxID=1397361 RepID=A0A0F2MHE4_SPOSC|nr:MFS transporter [Sporothrix schenckii 1099-18]KJR88285.1 MFS transporter [Sporothrix schenckii 1099-18]